jgi:hypothetical protein
MSETISHKLKDAGLTHPATYQIDQVLAKEKSKQQPHKHKWFKRSEDAEWEFCRAIYKCGGRRRVVPVGVDPTMP